MAMRRNRGDFARAFEMIGADAVEAAIKALAEGADIVVEDAKRRVSIGPPIKGHSPGALRDSIHKISQNKGRRIRIVADATNEKGVQYGQYVEFWPGREHPFMYPAMDANRDTVKQMVADAIKEAVRKNAAK